MLLAANLTWKWGLCVMPYDFIVFYWENCFYQPERRQRYVRNVCVCLCYDLSVIISFHFFFWFWFIWFWFFECQIEWKINNKLELSWAHQPAGRLYFLAVCCVPCGICNDVNSSILQGRDFSFCCWIPGSGQLEQARTMFFCFIFHWMIVESFHMLRRVKRSAWRKRLYCKIALKKKKCEIKDITRPHELAGWKLYKNRTNLACEHRITVTTISLLRN